MKKLINALKRKVNYNKLKEMISLGLETDKEKFSLWLFENFGLITPTSFQINTDESKKEFNVVKQKDAPIVHKIVDISHIPIDINGGRIRLSTKPNNFGRPVTPSEVHLEISNDNGESWIALNSVTKFSYEADSSKKFIKAKIVMFDLHKFAEKEIENVSNN